VRKKEKSKDSGYIYSNPNQTEEQFLLTLLKQISNRLKTEHGYQNEQIAGTYEETTIKIPISIFAEKLCPSEALTKYLKEKYKLTYHEISELINRNERGVWANYQRAIKKKKSTFEIKDSLSVPVTAFKNTKLSILECLICYLKDILHMKNSRIATLLKKNPSNIWTIYNRAKKKAGLKK
jgi:hypothetical protein